MNEPTIPEILAAVKPEEIKETLAGALPVALLVLLLSVVFSFLVYPISMILASVSKSFGSPVVPDWAYTAFFLGVVIWKVRGQSVHLPILGPVAWTILLFLIVPIVFACVYLPNWAVLPSILVFLTPIYLFAKILEKGRENIETGKA